MLRRVLAAVASSLWVALLVITFGVTAVAQAAFPGRNGRIAVGAAFLPHCGIEVSEIATMRPDGSGLRELTGCAGRKPPYPLIEAPDFSADGRHILFMRAGRPALMASDGSHRRTLPIRTRRQGFLDNKPSFAPDGRHFVYGRPSTSNDMDALPAIWRTSIDGKADRRIGSGWAPRLSPDGTMIAYVGRHGVELMNARSGKHVRHLITTTNAGSLDWAPDGGRLLWSPLCCDPGLFVISADGKGSLRRITSAGGRIVEEAVWSPDGQRIAFATTRYHGDDVRQYVWTMSARGTRLKQRLSSVWIDTDLFSPAPTLSWAPRRER